MEVGPYNGAACKVCALCVCMIRSVFCRISDGWTCKGTLKGSNVGVISIGVESGINGIWESKRLSQAGLTVNS